MERRLQLQLLAQSRMWISIKDSKRFYYHMQYSTSCGGRISCSFEIMYTFVRACFAIVMRRTMDQFATKSPKLQLVKGELFPIEWFVGEDVPENNLHGVNDVGISREKGWEDKRL
jgi:hypothetical protein